jgi:hypothetical protein
LRIVDVDVSVVGVGDGDGDDPPGTLTDPCS